MAAGRRLGRHSALVAIALAAAALSPPSADAASRVCRQLEAELAAAPGTARAARQSAREQAAIERQRGQLQIAKRRARESGCNVRIFGGGSSACGAINDKIDRMERNLARLERQRGKPAGAGRSRAQIMAALDANGCRDAAVAQRRLPAGLDRTRGLLDQIFGGGVAQRGSLDDLGDPVLRGDESRNIRRVPQSPDGGWVNDGGRIRYSAPPGRYRTLCVRTCDGYFFPMSNAASPSDFERDQANCQSSCPGTEVQIYYHRQGQESDAMVSGLSGQPYASLPTAWQYKRLDVQSPAGCSCGAQAPEEARNYSIIAGEPREDAPAQSPAAVPRPVDRPDPALDPETLDNLDGGLDAAALRRMAVAPKVGKPPPAGDERRVRVVGPAFLPDPEAAAGPPVPAPTQVR